MSGGGGTPKDDAHQGLADSLRVRCKDAVVDRAGGELSTPLLREVTLRFETPFATP